MAIDANNNLWVADAANDNVVELTSAGQVLSGTKGFTGGGINDPQQLAISPSGQIWIANSYTNTVSELSIAGAPLTPSTGIPVTASSVAIDHQGDVWALGIGNNAQVSEFSPNGSTLSGAGYTVGGFVSSSDQNGTIAIDGDGNVWVPVDNPPSIMEISNSGVPLSGADGYTSGVAESPGYTVVDGSGDLWFASAILTPSVQRGVPATYTWTITELIGIAAPVVTPLAAGVQLNMLGARP